MKLKNKGVLLAGLFVVAAAFIAAGCGGDSGGGAPEALMAEMTGDRERGLLAALLVEERKWVDTHSHVAELKRRYHIRHRKLRVSQVTRAIIDAQASGDPALPALEDELRALQRDLQREAEAVRELALARPGFPGHGPEDSPRQTGTP